MTSLLRDARFAVRLLRKNPGFTAVALLALALGIAATTAIFSVIYTTFLEPLPYRDANQLVMVWSRYKGFRNLTSPGDFTDWKHRATAFEDLQAWSSDSVNISTGSRPENVEAGFATPGFLAMLGYGHPLALGRSFLSEEATPGKENVVILTHSLWVERFARDPHIIGRQVRIDTNSFTVVGVLAAGPADRQQNRLWLPLAFTPEMMNHQARWLLVIGRLGRATTVDQANVNMAAVMRDLADEAPGSNAGWSAGVEPFRNNFLSDRTKSGLWLLFGAVVFVLLIASVNTANLLLARGSARQRELAVRSSLGASRGTLVRQLLVESLVLAALGGALGVGLASALMRAVVALMPAFTLPSESEIRLNVSVLLFALGASALAGILFGSIPAWRASRASMADALKQAGCVADRASHRLRQGLVIVELALALTLLAGGGVAIHSLLTMANVDLGLRPEKLLTFSLPLTGSRLASRAQMAEFYGQLADKVRAVPGVTAAAVSTGIPLQGRGSWFGLPFQVAGSPPVEPGSGPPAGFNMVSADYFRTFGIRMVRGRAFSDHDRDGSPPVAVVNTEFARRYLSGRDPLSQRLVIAEPIPFAGGRGPMIERQIVGVYRDVRNAGPNEEVLPEIDVPFAQCPWPQVTMAVRTSGESATAVRPIAAAVEAMDPDLPMADIKTMEQVVATSTANERFNTFLFGSFAGAALLLATIGVYGVMCFAVARRRQEIALRMALGASRSRVVQMVVLEGMTTAAVGALLGLIGAYAMSRTMHTLFYGVAGLDLVALSVVITILLGAALVACLVPALRAASVDPLSVLRAE